MSNGLLVVSLAAGIIKKYYPVHNLISQGKIKKTKTSSLPKYFCTTVLYKVWPSHTIFLNLNIKVTR